MSRVLITGSTSGLGLALKNIYQTKYTVDTVDRDVCDLENLDSVQKSVDNITKNKKYKHVFLNAGILGRLSKSKDLTLHEYNQIFNVNVWSNKIIIDCLIQNNAIENVICVSSGAASKPYFGWSLYCSAKAAMKQILSCYQYEYHDFRFLSLAPGLVKTKMQDRIYKYDENKIPSVKKFKDAYNNMQKPEDCAKIIFDNLENILSKSVDYFDIRDII